MQTVDLEKSEKGQQRRKHADGRLLHCCCICGKLQPWDNNWSTYCSEKEIDDGTAIPKFCSVECRNAGGENASKVTNEMKHKARDSEWREPILIWREMTDKEKYAEAKRRQQEYRPQ